MSRRLKAYNTAVESENKIHDDDTARKFGFAGGLVPGVEVHGYLAWGPVAAWGEDWLRRGQMSSRYKLPTYDGQEISVTFDEGSGEAQVVNPDGTPVSFAQAEIPTDEPPRIDLSRYAEGPLPDAPPAASPQTLAVGTQLGSIEIDFPDEKAQTYLADVREELPLYTERGYAHPGWVLGLANLALLKNVTLGPWIHVGSTVRNLGVIEPGAHVSTRGFVSDEYEKSGHRFVDLDLVVLADDTPVAMIAHTAIYRPRQVADAG
ncbi:hypothetical protein GCM10027298_15900 [Epidermidibacterium keratini]